MALATEAMVAISTPGASSNFAIGGTRSQILSKREKMVLRHDLVLDNFAYHDFQYS